MVQGCLFDHWTPYFIPLAYWNRRVRAELISPIEFKMEECWVLSPYLKWWDSHPLPHFDPVYDLIAHGDDEHRAWLKSLLDELGAHLVFEHRVEW